MKKIIFISLVIIFIFSIIFIYYNVKIFKKYDLISGTNQVNSNLPYLKYNFQKAIIYKGLNNDYLIWDVDGSTSSTEVRNEYFSIKEALNLKKNYYVDYDAFNKNKKELFGYRFIFTLKPHLIDEKVMFYQDEKNIYVGLWNIKAFQDKYLSDNNYPSNRKYDDVKNNLDYIPHIILKK